MVRLISRQRGGLAALKLTKLFGINDFPALKDSWNVLIIIIYCYFIIIIIIIIISLHYKVSYTKYPPSGKYRFLSPFLSIRKAKYQHDIASKMK